MGGVSVPAKFADHWNGSQERVLSAVEQGVTDPKAIVVWLDMDYDAVVNALRRLADKGQIRRTSRGHYERVRRECLLAEVWR